MVAGIYGFGEFNDDFPSSNIGSPKTPLQYHIPTQYLKLTIVQQDRHLFFCDNYVLVKTIMLIITDKIYKGKML